MYHNDPSIADTILDSVTYAVFTVDNEWRITSFNAAAEMITLFLGLEMLSMALYVLAGYRRSDSRSIEGSLKYFLLGAFASAILLMGMAYVYGVSGSLNMVEIGDKLNTIGGMEALIGGESASTMASANSPPIPGWLCPPGHEP